MNTSPHINCKENYVDADFCMTFKCIYLTLSQRALPYSAQLNYIVPIPVTSKPKAAQAMKQFILLPYSINFIFEYLESKNNKIIK